MSSAAQRYLDAFIAADKDGSGTLTREELATVLKENGMSAAKADKLMSKLDLNGDGIITLGEYKVALNISSQPMDAWKSLFESLDKDGGGTVSVDELKAFLRQAGCADMQDTIDSWIEDYDTNNDGQLNYQEFLGFIATLEC
uniref:EF-hand domain-containing protein n=1 Tax=Schistocephalus solidus TaxID=70667 RepID=A0A0X3Q2K1_SCHSO